MSSGRAGPGSWRPRARGFVWFILQVPGDFSGVVSAMDQVPVLLSGSVHGEGPRGLVLLFLPILGLDGAIELGELLFWRNHPKAWLGQLGQLQHLIPGLQFNKGEFNPLLACWVLAFSGLGNPLSSRADLSQQSPFVRPSSGLQGAFIFPSYYP